MNRFLVELKDKRSSTSCDESNIQSSFRHLPYLLWVLVWEAFGILIGNPSLPQVRRTGFSHAYHTRVTGSRSVGYPLCR